MCKRIEIPASALPDVEAALLVEKEAKAMRWLLGIRLLIMNRSTSDAAQELGVSDRIVRYWAHRFLDGGVDAMHPHSGGGHSPLLPAEDEERFKERIRQGPTEADGFATWRGPFVRDMLRREFDASYSRSGVYALLHRMVFSSLMPRAKHPESSEKEQRQFQKKHSPTQSMRCIS